MNVSNETVSHPESNIFVRMSVCPEMSDYLDKVDRLKWLVLSMPPPNHDTMKFMFSHLKRYETTPQSGLVPYLLNCGVED